jgi:quercetin dioxygenase-like cupin family protein
MITRRDVLVGLLCAIAAWGVAALAQQKANIMHSTAFDWNSMSAKTTTAGSVRSVCKAPTATLDELEMHVTTLNEGQASHPPHRHPNEEIVIIKEGTLEAFVNGEWKKLGPGSIIFNASNELHGVRNVGKGPATYHVINWSSPGMLQKKAQN